MSRLLTTVTTTLVCITALSANAEEKGQSVMFAPKQPEVDLMPDSGNQTTGDKCEALLQEAESLKGKPQRKHTILERYRLECTDTQTQ